MLNQIQTFGDSIEAASTNGTAWPVIAGYSFSGSTSAHFQQTLNSVNYGVSGETQPTSWTKAQANIPAMAAPSSTGFKFAQWKMWSANDGVTPAVIVSDYNTYISAFASLCAANGCIAVFGTHTPTAQITTLAADNQRIASNNNLRALVAANPSTMVLADYDAALSTGQVGGNQATIILGYSDDQIHPNAAGQAVMIQVLQSALRAYLTTYGP